MIAVLLICNYCGFEWIINYAPTREPLCSRCGDGKNVVAKDISRSKIDYYKGSPPFPEKKPTMTIEKVNFVGKIVKPEPDDGSILDFFFHGGGL